MNTGLATSCLTGFRAALAGSVAALSLSSAAFAQAPAAATEQVIVTGSRIVINGNDLPTPVTVLSVEQLQATTPTSIPDALNKMPAFDSTQSTTVVINGANGRGSNAPGNFLNLRGLGTIRNLILWDGNRVPGTFYDTTVDTDMLPQLLVQRVEVVTGGASAVYGSDAVTGVVNFITDNKFDGLKGVIQGGISDYGDVKSFRAGVAGGMDLGRRGHLIWSLEYYDRDALANESTRPYGPLNAALLGSGTAASPYTLATNVIRSNETWGGLPISGPFVGRMFAKDGTLATFHAGAATGIANTVIGGDGSYQFNQMLLPVVNTAQAFGRYDYNFTDSLHAYVSARYAMKRTFEANQHISNSLTNFPITIYSGNAFLTAAEQAELTATNTSSFQMARDDDEFTRAIGLTVQTGALSIAGGVNGEAWGDFTWDGHYTHGETRTQNITNNNTNAARFYAASDAVKDPSTGNIVCNVSITAPGAYPGCVPVDLFGMGRPSSAAIAWIDGNTVWTAHNGLDDFTANLTGTAFNDWAGPVKVAVGAEYRLASLVVTTSQPDPSFNPQYLRIGPYSSWGPNCSQTPASVNQLVLGQCAPLSSAQATALSTPGHTLSPGYLPNALAWIKEVQSPAHGSENVSEANIEVNAPLIANFPLIELLSFNGAYRYTQYSTSGNGVSSSFASNTWKLGMEWQVFDDLRFRATRSRDIRAPTLWDLYQLQAASSSGFNDPLTKGTGSITTISGGNPALKPEVARNTTAGLIYTPHWLPNFSFSADYYHIVIDNAIGAVAGTNTTVMALCLASPNGNSPYCNLLTRPISYNNTTQANFPVFNYSLNQNIAFAAVEGVDLEANYQTDLSEWAGVPGILHLRGLWTHQPMDKSQALPLATITNAAGTGTAPSDKATFTVDYALNNIRVDVLERYVAPIHWGADPTQFFAIPDVRAYFQTDINFAYDFVAADVPLTGFLNINNLTNTVGGIYPPTGAAAVPGMDYPSAPYMDVIGRYYTIGLRFKM